MSERKLYPDMGLVVDWTDVARKAAQKRGEQISARNGAPAEDQSATHPYLDKQYPSLEPDSITKPVDSDTQSPR